MVCHALSCTEYDTANTLKELMIQMETNYWLMRRWCADAEPILLSVYREKVPGSIFMEEVTENR